MTVASPKKTIPACPFQIQNHRSLSPHARRDDAGSLEMEADLPLIEISGEDDSLLCPQQTPSDDVSSMITGFSCSPLVRIPRSIRRPPLPPSFTERSSSCKDGRDDINKENINVNKPEVPKLSIEPQQMKRKKKGDGYNLRKSLAWDKAFFTEEGVLDPMELSMLSGNMSRPSGEILSVILEGRESISGGMEGTSESPGLKSLEDNLFKDLPGCTSNKEKKIAGILSPKPGLSARGKAKRKVFSAHDIDKNASKRSGCPRPVAPAPLKNLPNMNTTKVTTKDSKVTKQGSFVVSATSRTSTSVSSHPKHNQNPRPAVNTQKKIGLKGLPANTKSAPNDVKSGPTGKLIAKPAIQQARRNVVKVREGKEMHSSNMLQQAQDKQANGLKIVSDQVPPPVAHHKSICGSASKPAVDFPQRAGSSSGNAQFTQLPKAKPSGLRMPSPSLGFFGQSKSTPSLLQRSPSPGNVCESDIPKPSKTGKLNSIHQSSQQPYVRMLAGSSSDYPDSSIVNSISNGNIKLGELNDVQKVEVQVPVQSNSHEDINYQQQLNSVYGEVNQHSLYNLEPCDVEKISNAKDIKLKRSGDELIVKNDIGENMWNDVNSERVNDDHPNNRDLTEVGSGYSHVNPKVEVEHLAQASGMIILQNHSVDVESPSADVKKNSGKDISKLSGDCSSIYEVSMQSEEQGESDRSETQEANLVPNAENQRLWTNSTSFKEGRSSDNNSLKAADTTMNAQHFIPSYLKTTYGPSHCKEIEHIKDGSIGIGNLSCESNVRNANMQPINCNRSVESSKPSTSTVVNLHLNLSKESSVQFELPSIDINSKADCGFDVARKVESQSIEGTLMGSEGGELVVGNFKHELDFNGEAGFLESGTTGEGHVTDTCQTSEDFSANEVENPQAQSQNFPLVQVMVASEVKDMSVLHEVEKQWDSLVKNFVACPDSQPEPGTCAEMTVIPSDDSQGAHDTSKHSVELAKPINDFSNECIADANLTEGSRSENAHDICQKMEQAREFARVESTNKESLAEEAQVLSSSNNRAADNFNLDTSVLIADAKSLNVVYDNEVLEGHPELQKPDFLTENFSLQSDRLHTENPLLFMNVPFVESRDKDTFKNILDVLVPGNSLCESSFDVGTQACTATQDHALGMDMDGEHSIMDGTISHSMDIGPLADNIEGHIDGKCSNDEPCDQAISVGFVSSSDNIGDWIPFGVNSCNSEPLSSLNDKSGLEKTDGTSSGSMIRDMETELSKTNILPPEAEAKLVQANSILKNKMQHELDNGMYPKEDVDTWPLPKKSMDDKKEEALVIKPPANAVPFSDEWLAALEAAGEEILTRKGGAVQNSPTEKLLPEPSPWSPVRRKNNQEIGPYDCTKYTNTTIPPSNPN